MRRLEARTVVASYEAPAGLIPGEAGVVIDGRVDTADVVAAVIDLAVREILVLERVPGEAGDDVLISIERPWLHDPAIRRFEAVLLAHVFTEPGVRSVRLSALRGSDYAPTSIKDTLSDDLEERGYFAAGPRAMRRVGRGAALGLLAVWAQLAWNAGAGASTYQAGVVAAAALWTLASLVAANGLTAAGRRARHQLNGFRTFLGRVDKDRLEQLRWGALDPHLPWAIALGVTSAWLPGPPLRDR
jgi:hypothetical protein